MITSELINHLQSPTAWSQAEKIQLTLTDRKSEEASLSLAGNRVDWRSDRGRFHLETDKAFDEQAVPSDAPGLLAAVWVYHQLANFGTGQLDDCFYRGQLPWAADSRPADVLEIVHRGVVMDIFVDIESKLPIGFELSFDVAEDPLCVEIESTTSSDAIWAYKPR